MNESLTGVFQLNREGLWALLDITIVSLLIY